MKTIEEKAKAYDEALERAKKLLLGNEHSNTIRSYLEHIFPALGESEDERIRKDLIYDIERLPMQGVLTHRPTSEYIAYLEKQEQKPLSPEDKVKHPLYVEGFEAGKEVGRQFENVFGEQKPIEFKNDELVEIIKGEFEGFRNLLKKKGIDYEPQRGYWEGFARLFDSSAREYVKEQKPVEWSEEDEKKIHFLSRLIEFQVKDDEYCFGDGTMITKQGAIEMLKSLRPHWKPSEEQMKRLADAVESWRGGIGYNELKSLYNDLLKLK